MYLMTKTEPALHRIKWLIHVVINSADEVQPNKTYKTEFKMLNFEQIPLFWFDIKDY